MSARALVIMVLLLSCLPHNAFAQNPTFSSKVEAIRVDVLVTDRGKPVLGLGPGDFEIFDNGVGQQVDLVSFDQQPLNVILTLDMSDSVIGERLANLREAGRGVLDGLKTGDRAALVTFHRAVSLGADLTGDLARVRSALDETKPFGKTSVVDACFTGMVLGESDAGRALVIVFSDGLDTSSWLAPETVLEIAKRSDAVVYAVSVGPDQNGEFLRDLGHQTGGRLFEVESTKNLSAIFAQALEEFRRRYVISYSPRGVPADGWHQLTVRVKGRAATVKARPGYLAGK